VTVAFKELQKLVSQQQQESLHAVAEATVKQALR
jgi:hypothetical protein